MNPYRRADKLSKEEEEKRKRRAELSMFGVRQRPDGEWVPVLERAETNPCRECKGYGTYGNPLCGAVYNCKRCQGSGSDPEPQLELQSPPHQSLWQRLVNWWNHK